MNFNWSGYLNLAHELAGQPLATRSTQEAKLRATISRAYYASFCEARNYLRDEDGDTSIPTNGRAHRYVKDRFLVSRDKDRRKIGHNLNRLRTQRNLVDYQDSVLRLQQETKVSLRYARKIFSSLASI